MRKLLKKLKYEHFDYINESTHALTTLYGILCPKDHNELHTNIAKNLELLKSSILIIDDIIDKSPKRNGEKSLYLEIGVGSSILISEILKSKAVLNISKIVSILSPQKLYRILELIEHTYTIICQGQLDDIEFEAVSLDEISLNQYFEMIENTSAHFIALPAIIATILANKSEEEILCIRKFGIYLGLAYQIRDDVLDIVGDQEYCGKTEYIDIKSSKKRLPILLAYRKSSNEEKKEIDKLMNLNKNLDNEEIEYLLGLIKRKNSIQKCFDILLKFKTLSIKEIENWNDKEQYRQLISFTELLTDFQTLPDGIKREYGILN